MEDITLRFMHILVVALPLSQCQIQGSLTSVWPNQPPVMGKAITQDAVQSGSYPVLLEAVLRTEKAVFHAQLEACWALQGPGIVLAINT